jgi:ribonuclease R
MRVPLDASMNAKNGELVAADITSYPGDRDGFQGKITSVIGNALDPLTDIKRVLLQNHIPHQFHSEVEKEAKQFSEHVADADMKGRKDIRHLNFITIDGATAKDFDDAIFVESNGQGFKLYVAIADVSHYVRLGTAIDREAYERGTSVYFPNFVVPMLPEILSNGLCSLNPHLPRLALVAEMQMDFTGVTTHSEFYEAVIESKARVTYGEAQEVVDGNEVEKLRHVKSEILMAADLAKILMAKRFKDGSLDLEIPETQIVLDSSGVPTDFIRSERLFAHRLIEEMMLAANVAVATFLSSRDIPSIYRIHDSPNEDAISMLERYLFNFGSRVKVTAQGKLQKRLTKALQEFEGKPEAQILNILALRSMSQAKYSSDNVGHFGLGFDFYTHFTSPIRRYPDLIVHRLIKSQIMRSGLYKQISEEDLQTASTMLSACEQRSVKAERQFQAIKKARFMQKFVGEEFEGIVSSVTKFGVFVLLRQFEVDGLIRAENLSREKLEFDEDTLTLVGVKTGQKFSIGDVMTVQVASADPEAGQVDFQLAGEPIRPPQKKNEFGRNRAEKGARRHREERTGRDQPRGQQRDQQKSRGGKPDRQQDRKREAPAAKFSRPERKSQPSADTRILPKSRKAQAMDRMEEKVFEFLSEANSEAQNKGESFNPERHLQEAMKKWKARMGVGDSPSEEKKSRPQGRDFDKRFPKSEKSSGGKSGGGSRDKNDARGSGRDGGRKKSSGPGKRK